MPSWTRQEWARLSDAQSLGRIDFDDLQGERSYSGQTAYKQSKLASVMFTYELARRGNGDSGGDEPGMAGASRQ